MNARARAENRFAFLDRLRDLPSLPQVLVGVSRVASDPGSNAVQLADVILKDQALTLKVLRIANSAQYSLTTQRVSTVSRAVVLLGFESVRALALGLGAYHLLSSLERGGAILQGFWQHAIATAVVCQQLAGVLELDVPEEAFVAGLLHDVGKLVLAEHDPETAAAVYGRSETGPALLAAESAGFGVNHVEVGGELARRWELPEPLALAVARHHRHYAAPPADRGERLAFLVGVARTLARPLWAGTENPRALAAGMARVLRRPVGVVLEVLQAAPGVVKEYAKFFDLTVGDLKTYTLWVEEENQRLQELRARDEETRRQGERRLAEMAAVREVHGLILGGAAVDAVLGRLLRAAREVAGARRAVVARLVGVPPVAVPWLARGDVTPAFLENFRLPGTGAGALADALGRGQPVHVFDRGLPYFDRFLSPAEKAALDAPSFALLPLATRGAPLGVLYADRQEGDAPFADDELEALATFADLAALAVARA